MWFTLGLAECVVFDSMSAESAGIAQFVCQFAQTTTYFTSHRWFVAAIFLAGGLLPRRHFEGEQF